MNADRGGVAIWSPGPVVVAGPCVLEDDALNLRVAEVLVSIGARLGVTVIYKASFTKANRARAGAPRGPGLEAGLSLLSRVRSATGVPVLTDIHEPDQAAAAAGIVDVIQIPAFLCRQTDLLEAAGRTGKPVNIKKGQWMAPEDMGGAVEKVRASGGGPVAVTERGTFLGYGDLVVDMRSFDRLKAATGAPVVFDATHAVQRPGLGPDGRSAGGREHVPSLLRAAAAAGADGFFLETHPDPARAPCDGDTMWPLDELEPLLETALEIWHAARGGPVRA